MSKLSSGDETVPTETLNDLRLCFGVLLCRISLQLIQVLLQTSVLKDSSLMQVIL